MAYEGARERSPVTETEDDSLLSGCQPHLSTFTSPPSTQSERASERDGGGEAAYANVPHVDTVDLICHLNSIPLHEKYTQEISVKMIRPLNKTSHLT